MDPQGGRTSEEWAFAPTSVLRVVGTEGDLLTDQGRQYFAWRGKSEFQKLLLRKGVRHVVARAHHPATASAASGEGHPLALPPRRRLPGVKSRMRESGTSESVGGPDGKPPGPTRPPLRRALDAGPTGSVGPELPPGPSAGLGGRDSERFLQTRSHGAEPPPRSPWRFPCGVGCRTTTARLSSPRRKSTERAGWQPR